MDARAPLVFQPMSNVELAELRECQECFAIVRDERTAQHEAWHRPGSSAEERTPDLPYHSP